MKVKSRSRYLLFATSLAAWLTLTLHLTFANYPVLAIQIQPVMEAVDLQELLPGFDYSEWYQQQSGFSPDEAHFGAYVIEPVGEKVYLGFSTGKPAETDGAVLAETDGSVITAVSTLNEQGFTDMQAADEWLYIPGTDPCCGDGWDSGNFYIKFGDQPITKHRNLPNVLHAWGVWFDEDSDILYTAVSSHLGDNQTWTGEVFSSTNQGENWVRVGNNQDGLGDYRTYDVIGFANRLYAVWNDTHDDSQGSSNACGLTMSEDGGVSWTRITTTTQQPLSCRARLHVWDGQLLALSHEQDSLITLTEDQKIEEKPFKDFRVSKAAYHLFAHDDGGFLYTLSDNGQILRTANLTDWQIMTDIDLEFVSIAFWPSQDKLVLSERGNGRLWTFDLAAAEPILPATPPAKNIIVMIADGWGANHIAAANAYTDQVPAYQTWPRYWISTYQAGNHYEPVLAWQDFDYSMQNATDSAAAATALFTGKKTANGRIAVNEDGTSRFISISEKAQRMGKATGIVTSVYLSHATPGAWMSHNKARSNGFAIADEGLWGDPNTTGTTAGNGRYSGGFGSSIPQDVVIGAGHPAWNGGNYVNILMRDKLASENGQPGSFLFVERISGSDDGGDRLIQAANMTTTTRLAGLFGGPGGNLDYQLANGSGQESENPTLAEMTAAALTVLNRTENGFALLVEGGAVDWASHSNNMDQMIGELNGFNEAVQIVVAWVDTPGNGSNWENTLVIVTGDHETGYLTKAPGIFADQPLGVIDDAALSLEKTIGSTGRRASWIDGNGNDEIDEGEEVNWAWNSGGHSNSLIPLYARGVGADLFSYFANDYDLVRGVYLDNTDVYSILDFVLKYDAFLPFLSMP